MDGVPFFLAVAQHRRNKNLLLLMSAFAELCKRSGRRQDMRLVIVGGEGPETLHLRQQVKQLSLEERVVFMASITDAEMCWLYRNCELLIAPSSIEGFGLPVVEALQCGARVVCSDIPSFREIAGPACRYFDLKAAAPASALADVVSLALQESTNKPGMLDKFSAREIAAQHVSLYSRLLEVSVRCTNEPASKPLDRVIRYDGFAG